ncbi:EmrB/QacA subfamily drug resistance transporter [Friedmanniella endophytica]|uniref:EmrB/QacA subfamily drug resistance transporter n=1 Tax=Microlunatus kandeliicorticis TaxID=1759536 RepID=A0A7W3IUT4_9ACTN|nr:MFS transporter [Microlunatus kandeliicorticis]MBA8795664.1 EmrB/QacA subfamily drug resistance transporter [Microlunatus kandeliicorticis]
MPGSATTRRPSTLNRPLALLVAGTFFMENLDATIIATAAPAMARDLGVAAVDVNAAMTAYLVTVAIGIPVSGWLTDRFGGRRILLLAIAVFTLSSVLCALSVNLPMLVVARIVQGAGGALMVPVGRLVVLRVTARSDLLDAIAYLTWPALLAPVVAPAIGGWIVTVAGWPWIFLINVPLGVVAAVVAWRIVPDERAERVGRLDLVGFLLCAGLLGSALVALESVSAGAADSGTLVVLLLGLAAALTVAVVLWWRRTPEPLLRFGSLRVASFRTGNAGGLVYRMLINAVPFLLPLLFQLRFGLSPVRAGLLVLLLFVGNLAIKPVTSPLIRRFGFRLVLIISVAAGAAMMAAIAAFTPTTSLLVIVPVLVASGAFRSIGFSGYNSLQFADIEPADMADANTLSATLQQLAVGLGVAVGALLLRFGDALAPDGGSISAYGIAFAALAVLMLIPLVEAVVLPRTAGDEVAARR